MKTPARLILSLFLIGAGWLSAATFSNLTAINFSTSVGVGAPYPSTITVSGLSGTITRVTVGLLGVNHPRPDDMQLLLVAPTGQKFVLLADAGGTSGSGSVNLTLDDVAASQVPDAGPLTTGTFQPTCVDFQNNIQTEFPAPAPAGPYAVPAPRGVATLASTFNGLNPNGTWRLYAVDDVASSPGGSIAGGWELSITTGALLQATTTTLSASPNPSFVNSNVTFTATVTANGSAVTVGTVTFKEGATLLAGPVSLNGSGQASFSTPVLGEGSHTISATYNAVGSFNASSGTIQQTVDTATTVLGNTFCNRGTISVSDTTLRGSVYPSRIFVSGLSGTISKLTLMVSNISFARPDDLELLLVAPNGAHMVVMADAGGTTAGVSGVHLNFDDFAANQISDTVAPTSGSYRPTDHNSTAPAFPPPAPVGPYNQPAPAGGATLANRFNGLSPNGTWSLYVVEDVAGGGGSIGGWCLTFTTSGDAATLTTVTSSLNPSRVGQPATFTASVRRASNNSAVSAGTVTFREGASILATGVVLDLNGNASLTNAALAEGNHVISADYSGTPGQFNTSSGNLNQRVDAVTSVNGNQFCNNAGILLPASGDLAAAYPSRILVSGLGNMVAGLTVSLNGLTIDRADDLEFLLVSPTGAKFVLVSDAGGLNPLGGVNLTFSDAAASFLPDGSAFASGTYRPSSYNNTAVSFPGPAPAGPYLHAGPTGSNTLASVFGGTDPNGYWSLYAMDDVAGAGGSLSGWCLTISTPPTIACPTSLTTTAALGQCQSAPLSFNTTASGIPTPTVICRVGGTVLTSPAIFPIGVSTVTCTASNSVGTNACAFTLTVQDGQKPVMNCPANIYVAAAPGQNSVNVEYVAGASDNCGSPLIICTPASGASFPVGITSVNCLAADSAGNTNSCSFTVTVNHNPVANPDHFQTPTNTSLAISALALLNNDSDTDGHPRVLISTSSISARGGTIVTGGGNYSYRPPTNFFGPDYFQYVLSDSLGGRATGVVHVAVIRPDGFRFSLQPTNGNQFRLRFVGMPGRLYQLQTASSLHGPWNYSTLLSPATNAQAQLLDSFFPGANIFYRAVETPSGAQSLWRGENQGHDTYGLRHAQAQNGLSYTNGRVGRAFSFDGVDDVLAINAAALPVPWTAALWVNRQPSSGPSATMLDDGATGLKLEQWPNTQLVGFTQFGVADYYFNYSVPTNVWTHLVFVGTAGGTQLFVNGQLQDVLPNSIDLPLGQVGHSLRDPLRADLDEIEIFSRALTPLEVLDLYLRVP